MKPSNHIHHSHPHLLFSYPASLHQRLYSLVVVPVFVLVIVFFVVQKLSPTFTVYNDHITFGYIFFALLSTFFRLIVSYFFAILIAVPLALLINYNEHAERVLLPVFDIIQSVPVLAFFPVIILFFVHYHFYNGAAIFILILTMMWSIVFSMVGGLRVIPQDIKAAAQVFHLRGWDYVSKVLLPSVFPYLVTGSLLAWAGGWNIIIVAEVLHTYIPGGGRNLDLFGIGSLLVNAAASGNQHLFFITIVFLVVAIGLLNFFVWQKLLKYAEKFKFE